MTRQRWNLPLAALVALAIAPLPALAQRGRGGGGMGRLGGGGGMARPGGGGGMARPSMPVNRPALGGANRMAPTGGMARPANINRPAGNLARPGGGGPASGLGGGNRPATLPGQLGGGGLGGGAGNRPSTLPGSIGGNRPGGGDGGRPGGGFPGLGGGGNRPTTLPGNIAGNRPGGNLPGGGGDGRPGGGFPGLGGGTRPGGNGGGIAGGGNGPGGGGFPGLGPNRPGGGFPGLGSNRPGVGNRPGLGNLGSGNIGQIGDNLGVVNRPVTNINNSVSVNRTNLRGGNTINGGNRTNVVGGGGNVAGNGGWGGGWGGGNGGWGGGYGRGYGGFRGGVGGWASPYYGSWYRGRSGGNGFWAGLGVGTLTRFGIGRAWGGGFYGPGVYNFFPTWGVANFGAWGLDSMAGSMLAANYSNPYYAGVVAAEPAPATVVYDYSQPINVNAAPTDAAVAESTEQVFSAARDAFKAGDYGRAVDLADQVLKQTPNVPVVHEFRALALFALGRYDEAAAVNYAVLSAGPAWNWSTLVNLYPDVDTYTIQLRALEAYAGGHPDSTSAPFLLGYHYMVQGHAEAAAAQFEKVTRLQPDETLSASFVKALREATAVSAQAAAADSVPPTSDGSPTGSPPTESEPPPPPADMAGRWTARPAPDVTIALDLRADGGFSWAVEEKGRTQTIEGHAGFQDDTLALLQDEGPPLLGKVTRGGKDQFVFAPPGANAKAPGLTFTR